MGYLTSILMCPVGFNECEGVQQALRGPQTDYWSPKR